MESWRTVWRNGFTPLLSIEQLEYLKLHLVEDRPTLVQGATTTPPPLMCVQDWPCEAGCLLATCGAAMHGGFTVATVGQCEEEFAKLCFEADNLLGEPAACRWLLNWYDDTPRDQMRKELLEEVELAILAKHAHAT